MKITTLPSPPRPWARLWVERNKLTKVGVGVLLLAILTAGSFIYGVSMRPKLAVALAQLGMPEENRVQSLLSAPGNYLGSLFATQDLDTLVFDIKFKHISKLTADRNAALDSGILNTSSEDYVPATIRYLDRTIPVKLRLKGDNTDHLEGEKWSFLIKTRNNDQLFGMRRFSVMNPFVRAHQQEPLAFAYLRTLGFLAPRYNFVNLVVNGSEVGIMALEEYPAKEFIESQGRRESVIIRFNEDFAWEDAAVRGEWDLAFDNYAIAPVKVVQEGAIRKSAKLTNDYQVATGLLKGFVRGELPASAVFDVDEYGRFLAALEILNASNGLWWANLRFYYNPVSARLEPVASDLMSESPWGLPRAGFELHSLTNGVSRAILADPKIRQVFVSELHRLASEIEAGSVEEFLQPLEEEILSVLRHDSPLLLKFNHDQMRRRAAHLAKVTVDNLDYFNSLGGEDGVHSNLVLAQTIGDADNRILELVNAIPAPVEVTNIHWVVSAAEAGEQTDNTTSVVLPIEGMEFPIELAPTENYKLPKVFLLPLPTNPDLETPVNIRVDARIKGTDRIYSTNSIPSVGALAQRPINAESVHDTLTSFPFIRQQNNDTLAIVAGEHKVMETINIPEGLSLIIPAGTRLLFSDAASLVVQGALTINGSESNPVLLDAIPIAGEETGWPGLLVLGTGQVSSLEHVTFRNTTGVVEDSWELTGGVNFYQGKVHLSAVTFEDNRAEDALNIIRSEFALHDVHVNNTVSDGFDSDYSNGTIDGGLFQNIGTAGGGDAIDVSGSKVVVTGTRIQDVSDKGLSVGEGSDLTARGVVITRALTGAASKDASKLLISDSYISDYRMAGLMAYVKKPEYGPSSIISNNVQFSGSDGIAFAQTGSKIQIDDQLVPANNLDVDALYVSHMAKAAL